MKSLLELHRELGIPANYAADRQLTPCSEAAEPDLIDVGRSPDGRNVRLQTSAAEGWRRMHAAAAVDQVQLIPISGFRSIERQTEILQAKLKAGQRIDDILRYVAAPGFSEHHTGRALDIGSPEHIDLDEDFARTAAFRWLELHAGEFGFTLTFPSGNRHGIGFEPWHWCWHDHALVK